MVECTLPREQQMRLNPFTGGGSAGKGELREKGADGCVAMSYSSLN